MHFRIDWFSGIVDMGSSVRDYVFRAVVFMPDIILGL